MKHKFYYQKQISTLKNVRVQYVLWFFLGVVSLLSILRLNEFSKQFSKSKISFFKKITLDYQEELSPNDGISNPFDFPAEVPESKEESKNEKENKDEVINQLIILHKTIHSFLSNSIEKKNVFYFHQNISQAESSPLYLLYHSFKIFFHQ
jgi:hypothetical protein